MIIHAITQVSSFFRDIYRGVTVADLDQQQALAHRLEYVQSALYPMRVDPLANCSDIDPFVPWFLACTEPHLRRPVRTTVCMCLHAARTTATAMTMAIRMKNDNQNDNDIGIYGIYAQNLYTGINAQSQKVWRG